MSPWKRSPWMFPSFIASLMMGSNIGIGGKHLCIFHITFQPLSDINVSIPPHCNEKKSDLFIETVIHHHSLSCLSFNVSFTFSYKSYDTLNPISLSVNLPMKISHKLLSREKSHIIGLILTARQDSPGPFTGEKNILTFSVSRKSK